MKRLHCDTCEKHIEQGDVEWYGLDAVSPPAPIDPDYPDGPKFLATLPMGEHEFHFCSPSCLAEWAFSRSLHPSSRR